MYFSEHSSGITPEFCSQQFLVDEIDEFLVERKNQRLYSEIEKSVDCLCGHAWLQLKYDERNISKTIDLPIFKG